MDFAGRKQFDRKISREHWKERAAKFPADKPFSKRAADQIHALLDVWAGIPAALEKPTKSASWSHLNEVGQKAAKRNSLADGFRAIAKTKADLKALRATLEATTLPKVPSLDKTDMVTELREQEMRRIVREMPQEKRDRLERMSPAMLAAVVRADPSASGVSPSVHAMARTQILEASNPEKFAEYREASAALEMVDEVVRETEAELRKAGEFAHDVEFAAFHKIVVEEQSAPKRTFATWHDAFDAGDIDAAIDLKHREAARRLAGAD
jgi:hypothetical protein